MPMIDVDFTATLFDKPLRWGSADGLGRTAPDSATRNSRRFELEVSFSSDAPTTVFFGPSGAGKSLTLQAVAGLLRPSTGHVRINGRTLFDSDAGVDVPPSKRATGFLFQDYALFPHLSVRANVAFGLTDWRRRRLSAAQAGHVEALLESFGLAELAETRPAHLSGGQRQRVALARALAPRPQLLLLDEPFAALNPLLRDSLRAELAAVRRHWNVPMLMISHDVDDVLAVGDVVCVFENGRIVREIDLRSGQSRDVVRRELAPGAPDSNEPGRVRLRRMLLSAVHTDGSRDNVPP